MYLVVQPSNNYTLSMVFGKKGAGKSTYLAKQAIKFHKKGWQVYSTVEVPFAKIITDEDLKNFGRSRFPENSLILIDEVGMIWDNRDFKNFNHFTRDYFKLQRHYKNRIILFSQSFDVDKKLRDLTDDMRLVKRVGKVTIVKKILKKVDVATDHNGQGSLAEVYKFASILSNRFIFLPRYYDVFDSHEVPNIPNIECEEVLKDWTNIVKTSFRRNTLKREVKRLGKRIINIFKKIFKKYLKKASHFM